jgi:hypothetical protein
MSKCLRCGAGPEWLQGKIPDDSEWLAKHNAELAAVNVRNCTLETAVDSLNAELVAEREQHNVNIKYADEQLAAAQAAIAEVIKLVKPWQEDGQWFYSNSVNQKIHELLKSTDLSALAKHDTEVSKPLVEDFRRVAIKWIEQLPFMLPLRQEIEGYLASLDALARHGGSTAVKEGK